MSDVPDLVAADLTPYERELVVDGCGLKARGLVVPDFGVFDDACAQHDAGYWQGGSEADRQRYDRQFLLDMLAASRRQSWWKRPWLSLAAWTYYRAVQRGGALVFGYRSPRRGFPELREAVLARYGPIAYR